MSKGDKAARRRREVRVIQDPVIPMSGASSTSPPPASSANNTLSTTVSTALSSNTVTASQPLSPQPISISFYTAQSSSSDTDSQPNSTVSGHITSYANMPSSLGEMTTQVPPTPQELFFPPDSHVFPFPYDFGLFPQERHEFTPRQVTQVAASSSSASALPVPGPSTRPIQTESNSGPVITAEDYLIDSDSDAPLLERPSTPPTSRKGKGKSKAKGKSKSKGKGKGKARDSDAESSPERAPASPTSAPRYYHMLSSPSGTPRSPPVSPTPHSSPSVSPRSSPSRYRISFNPPAHHSASRRPFSSEITRRRHRRRIRGHHPLDEVRRLIGRALAVVPRTMETLRSLIRCPNCDHTFNVDIGVSLDLPPRQSRRYQDDA